jgi:hypothetical protein
MAKIVPRGATLIGFVETGNAKISIYEQIGRLSYGRSVAWYAKIEYSEKYLAKIDSTPTLALPGGKVEVKQTDSLSKIQETIANLKRLPNSKYMEYQRPRSE